MVGLVLVSHSARLAEGLREMVAQVAGDDVPVAIAGGTDDGRLGTSAELIAAAIRSTLGPARTTHSCSSTSAARFSAWRSR